MCKRERSRVRNRERENGIERKRERENGIERERERERDGEMEGGERETHLWERLEIVEDLQA